MRKRIQRRNRLEKQIANTPSQTDRALLARYGKTVPLIWWVEKWHRRFQTDSAFRDKGKLPEHDRAGLLGIFMRELVNLNAEWFEEIGETVRAYREHQKAGAVPAAPDWLRLSDAFFWLVEPPLTRQQIAERIGYSGNMESLSRIIKRLGVPCTKLPGGRPRKLPTNKQPKRF